jgi:hypothetical protein
MDVSFYLLTSANLSDISRDEFLEIISTISSVMQHLGFDPESFGNPTEIVEGLFRPRGANPWDASLKESECTSDAVYVLKRY